MQVGTSSLNPSFVVNDKPLQIKAITPAETLSLLLAPVAESASSEPTQLRVHDESAAQRQQRFGAHLEYDKNTQGRSAAISTYLSHQHLPQREALMQQLGIDTYV